MSHPALLVATAGGVLALGQPHSIFVKLGPYEVVGELGRGGMGAVFRARAPDGRAVALKLLLRGARAERFDRERRFLAELGEEQGFVPLLDAGDSSQGPWLAMPLLAGGTLRERFDRGPLPPAEVAELGRALASALATAHGRGIVHRDLKPENVLFTSTGLPLVADLGIAKHFASSTDTLSLSMPGELRGTIGYMSPEQLQDARSVDDKADVFALGAILHEALAGKPAFVAPTVLALLEKVRANDREPLPREPAWLAATIDAALSPDPARRPTMRELARALVQESAPARRRSLLAAGVAGALVLVLLPLVGLALGFASTGRGELDVALDEARAATLAKRPSAALERASFVQARARGDRSWNAELAPVLARIHDVAVLASDWKCERDAWTALQRCHGELGEAVPPRANDVHFVARLLASGKDLAPGELDELEKRSPLDAWPLEAACAIAFSRAKTLERIEVLAVKHKLRAPPSERPRLVRFLLGEVATRKPPSVDDLAGTLKTRDEVMTLPPETIQVFKPALDALGLARRVDPSVGAFPKEALPLLGTIRLAGTNFGSRRSIHEDAWVRAFGLALDHPTHLALRVRMIVNDRIHLTEEALLSSTVAALAALEEEKPSLARAVLAESVLCDSVGPYFADLDKDEYRKLAGRLAALAPDRPHARAVFLALIARNKEVPWQVHGERAARLDSRPEETPP